MLRTICDSFYFYICLLPSSSFLRERSRIVLHLRSLPISDKTLFDLGPFQCHHPEMTNPRYNQYRPPSYTTRRRNAAVSSVYQTHVGRSSVGRPHRPRRPRQVDRIPAQGKQLRGASDTGRAATTWSKGRSTGRRRTSDACTTTRRTVGELQPLRSRE